jgi:CHAD domain-containing protein
MSGSSEDPVRTFLLGEVAPREVEAILARHGRLELAREKQSLRLLDTFDRRLTRLGIELRLWGAGARPRWELAEPNGAVRGIKAPARTRFATDLPAGPLQARLADLTSPRRLLQIAGAAIESTTIRIVGSEGEKHLEVLLERYQHGVVADLLWLRPAPGFETLAQTVEEALEVILEASPITLRADFLAPLESVPEPRPPALGDPLPSALRSTLAHQLRTFELNLDGARRNLDSEFLHDLRVATRRSRALLGEIRRELADPAAERLRAELRRIAGATNEARDLDVLLLDLADEKARAPAEDRHGLHTVELLLRSDRLAQARRVRRLLGGPGTAKLLKHWHAWMADNSPADAPTIEAVATKRLRRRVRRLIDDARRAEPATNPADLHELRLAAKKVRYLLEAWGTLVVDDVGGVIRQLKAVQDRLGELNDLAVQDHRLRALAARLDDHRALLALGAWIERLRARRERRQRELLEHREVWLPQLEAVAVACRRGRRG